MSRPDLILAREFEAALAWWLAAGVDCDLADDVTVLLDEVPAPLPTAGPQDIRAARRPAPAPGAPPAAARPAPASPAPAPPAALRRDLLGESPPQDLAAFRQWWMEAPGLDTARGFPRVAPRGERGAALMVLVPQPEEGDRERLLGGSQGRLLDAILAAMGVAQDDVYLAAALPCHTPMADLAALATGGMEAVTRHHIALVNPARLIVFGTGLAPMLGAAGEQDLRKINHVGGKIPALASETLDALMNMPRLKARFWRRWIEWSAPQ
jgi:DNA polymerase